MKKSLIWILYIFLEFVLILLTLHFLFSAYMLKDDWAQYKEYSKTSCQVVSKKVVSSLPTSTGIMLGNFPVITVKYTTTAGEKTTDAAQDPHSPVYAKNEAQEEADAYKVNESDPCLYKKSDPSYVLLDYSYAWPVVLIEFFLIWGLLSLIIYLKKLRKRWVA